VQIDEYLTVRDEKGEREMKYYLKIFKLLFLIFLSFIILDDAFAWVALPTLSIKGNIVSNTASDADNLVIKGGTVIQINYRDGTLVNSNSKLESLINAEVLITGSRRTGDYTFSDARLIIRGGGFTYFEADLVNIVFVTDGSSWYLNPGMDVTDGSTANLKNIRANADAAHPSRYIEELNEALRFINKSGISVVATSSNEGDMKGDFSGTISGGLIAAPLYLTSPIGVRTTDYWEKHYIERSIFAYDAVSDEVDVLDVFPDKESLDAVLGKKNKTLLEEVKTELAALLLNIAAGLDPSKPMGNGLEISVKDAVMDIENTIRNSSESKEGLEKVKKLTESINNTNF